MNTRRWMAGYLVGALTGFGCGWSSGGVVNQHWPRVWIVGTLATVAAVTYLALFVPTPPPPPTDE